MLIDPKESTQVAAVVQTAAPQKLRLGDMLVQQGLLSQEQLVQALASFDEPNTPRRVVRVDGPKPK